MFLFSIILIICFHVKLFTIIFLPGLSYLLFYWYVDVFLPYIICIIFLRNNSSHSSRNLTPWMYSLILVCTVYIPSIMMTMPYDEQCKYLVILANVSTSLYILFEVKSQKYIRCMYKMHNSVLRCALYVLFFNHVLYIQCMYVV
jgi:hypothetical protein